jgi:hypothetical protein
MRPDLNCCFVGSATELIAALKRLLASEEVIVRCQKEKRGRETQFVRCSLKKPRLKVPLSPGEVEQTAGWPEGKPTPAPKEAVPALVEALSDTDSEGRSAAVNFLGRIGPDAKAAVPALAKLLKDKDRRIRNAAAEALERIDPAAQAPGSR